MQQKAAGGLFFRKAGEETFFGARGKTSFFGRSVQAKLTVSSPDDPQEKEADAVAEKVMRMAEPVAAPPEKKEEDKLQRREDAAVDSAAVPAEGLLQRKEEAPHPPEKEEEKKLPEKAANSTAQVRAKEEKKDEEKLQPKAEGTVQRAGGGSQGEAALTEEAGGEMAVQRKNLSLFRSGVLQESGRGPPASSLPFEQQLAGSRGGGSALPTDTRQFMESRFGADFGGVRIHTGSAAEGLSRTIGAQAFTHGNDIYFNSGKFSPQTAEGGALLAHELTHTIQQGASGHRPSSVTTSTVAQRAPENAAAPAAQTSLHNKASSGSPATLRDLRREVFHVDQKDDRGVGLPDAAHADKALQPFTEGRSWQVSGNGKLHTGETGQRPAGPSIVHLKEEGREEKEKKEQQAPPQPKLLQRWSTGTRQAAEGLAQRSVITGEQMQPASVGTTIGRAVVNRTAAASALHRSAVKDRGPPAVTAIKETTQPIQRSWLGNAWNAVSGLAGEATQFVSQGLDAAKQWILRRIRGFVQNIPGYRMFSLILRQDPITGEAVERNGRNLLLAGLDLLPLGNLFRQVLERIGAIDEAAAWIDGRLADLHSMVAGIGSRFEAFMAGLSLDAIGRPETVLNNVADLFRGIYNNVTGFLRRAAVSFLEMIKRIMLRLIVDFVRARIPRLYPLLRVALGHDPVTGEVVARNGANILYAAMDATDAGREQRRQLQGTGTFQRVAAWIDRGIAVFSTAYGQLRTAFTNLWSAVTIESLSAPLETFDRIYNDFAVPVTLVGRFLRDLAVEIVRAIKDALLRRLRDYARGIRGYTLVTVLIGRDPFTGEPVQRTIPNIIRGFMGLMEGGEEQYRQMEESGAIARTTQRILAAVARLNMTPAYIIQLFTAIWSTFGLNDLANPVAAFQRVMARFGAPIGRLVDFVIEIVRIVVEVLMQVMSFPGDLIANIISRAMQAFELIKRDPVGFLKNLLRAIKQGFVQFFGRIATHLLQGLTGWLLSELREANVPVPTDFSLRGVIGWVLQVLGISMERIWEKLAAHPRIGPERVARIRRLIHTLEGIWTFIKDVQERGIAAIWDKIQEQLTRLWDTVLDAIKNWIMERVVNQMVSRLLSMLDPTGIMAVVNSAIALYRAVQSFVRYLRQMLEIVNSFVEGTVEIAQGNVRRAADFLERTMGRAMPVVIGFLANQVGLSGIGRRIGEMIGRAREMVDTALTWLVNRAVNAGMALLDRVMAMGRSAVGAVTGWLGLRKDFRTRSGEAHSLSFRQSGSRSQLMVASGTPQPLREFVTGIRLPQNRPMPRQLATDRQLAIDFLNQIETLTNTPPANLTEDQRTRQIQQMMNVASETVANLMTFAGGTVRASRPPVFAGKYGDFGRGMRVEIVGQPVTTGSDASATPAMWNALVKRKELRPDGRSYYVRGHLLSQHLGGDGAEEQNLTPLTQAANQDHESRIESPLKRQVDANVDHAFIYVVNPTYGRSASSSFQNSINSQAGWNSNKKQDVSAIIPNEQFVPTALVCTIQEIDPLTGAEVPSAISGTHMVPNPINQSIASYITENG